jgi:ribosomal protein L29
MADAQEELRNLRSQLFHLRLQHARGEVKNNRQFQQIRADIARLMFRLGELNREAQAGVEAEPDATPELAAPNTKGQ